MLRHKRLLPRVIVGYASERYVMREINIYRVIWRQPYEVTHTRHDTLTALMSDMNGYTMVVNEGYYQSREMASEEREPRLPPHIGHGVRFIAHTVCRRRLSALLRLI